jgi:uncharacterized protein (DUF1697 family)
MTAHVAMLRGINVGGKNKLPMDELVQIFEAAGCRNVRTYIQSGNVVFEASRTLARKVPAAVQAGIASRRGYDIPVVLRTSAEMRRVVEANPFPAAESEPRLLHVVFLAAKPTAERVRKLDPGRSAPDEFELCGREIYLHCPGGMARTKFTNAYFDSRLATVSTARNWATVLKLAAMLD